MILRFIRRTVLPGVISLALLLQALHVAHPQVICRDADGSRLECADLLGRCACQVPDECHAHATAADSTLASEFPPLQLDQERRRCEDIAVTGAWRQNRVFQILPLAPRFTYTLHIEQWAPRLCCEFVTHPGPSPPPRDCVSRSLLSAWLC